ncbi:MAG TPA: hypothetical protein VGB45_07025 [Abditibacterium sp.]|jgi:uncharacterized metal-binding protein
MLIVALLGAFIFYVGLYLLWSSNQVPLDSVSAVLGALNRMMWMPENLVFTIFRGLLLVAALYIFADSIISFAKRLTRKRNNDEKNALSWKKPPRV